MVSVSCIYFIGSEKDAHKYKFGGNPEGTLELYNDHIDIFKKSKAVSSAFGAIGSAIEGKGKYKASISKEMITNYKKNKNNKYVLYLRDGNVLDVTITGLSKKESIKAMDDFLNNDYKQNKKRENIQNNNYNNINEDRKEKTENINKTTDKENSWICVKCGTDNSGKFCINCGEKKKEQQEKIENNWICVKCGRDNSGKFCINCGEKKKEQQEKIENNWKCEKCGRDNSDKFCINCGEKKPEKEKAIENTWTCEKCGTNNSGRFCIKCGNKKREPEEKIENKFCVTCGRKVEKEFIYCPYCGNKII